jgi:hypothetical protein
MKMAIWLKLAGLSVPPVKDGASLTLIIFVIAMRLLMPLFSGCLARLPLRLEPSLAKLSWLSTVRVCHVVTVRIITVIAV